MSDLEKEADKLYREISRVQKELYIILYLFTDPRSSLYGKLEQNLRELESKNIIIWWGEFARKYKNISNLRIPEMRLLQEIQILNELLKREKEVCAKTFNKFGILHFSQEILKIYEEYKQKGYCFRKKAILDKFLNTDKYLERLFPNAKYLSNSEFVFHRLRGVDIQTPEMSYYRDMCFFYNSYLDSLAEIENLISNKTSSKITEIIMGEEYYKKFNINWRLLRFTITSAVTFVESGINALHFEFLNALHYEEKREKLRSELNSLQTSKRKKRHLAQIFRVDPTKPQKRDIKSYPSLDWKLRNIPPLLSGKDENKPDLNKKPYKTFSTIRKYYRNSLIHPIETKYELILNGSEISRDIVDSAIDVVEDLYKLSFGTKHGYLWWLAKPGKNGKFPDPDKKRKLSEIRNKTKIN